MSWEESMFAVFEDLEQQAAGLHHAERDAEVADLSIAEYSRIGVSARLHASLGLEVRARLVGGRIVTGRVARMGEDWVLLADPGAGGTEWIIRLPAVLTMAGLSTRADSEDTWSVVDRLTLRAVLRQLAVAREACVVHFLDDQQLEGRVGRVGRDFFEVHVGGGAESTVQLVVLTGVVALQRRSR